LPLLTYRKWARNKRNSSKCFPAISLARSSPSHGCSRKS